MIETYLNTIPVRETDTEEGSGDAKYWTAPAKEVTCQVEVTFFPNKKLTTN